MVSQRVSAFVGSGVLIVGAILIGEALHVTVVRGVSPITDPDVLLRAAIGVGLVLVGYRLDVHPREYLSSPSDREDGGGDEHTAGAFDEALSPLDGESFDSIEARERERASEREHDVEEDAEPKRDGR